MALRLTVFPIVGLPSTTVGYFCPTLHPTQPGQEAAVHAVWMASVTGCRHILGPVHPRGVRSTSPRLPALGLLLKSVTQKIC